MCNLSQQFPQTSARFGHDETSKPARSILHKNRQKAFCIIGGESRGIRISSRQQTEMTENSTKTSGSVLYTTLHYFSTKFCFISFIYVVLEM